MTSHPQQSVSLLVALDFSAVAEAQLDVVREIATPQHVIHLLHVAEPDPSFIGMEAGPDEVRSQVAREFRQEHQRLGEMAALLRDAGHEVHPLLVQGPTIQTILAEAERVGAAMIVVGSHGHGKLFDLVVGSVSAGVIRKATVPVLVVPSR
jgi:nucleotide-binding universal stress UspA family protein